MTSATQLEIAHSMRPADEQLDALLHGAGVAPLDDLGWLRVTGSDRVRWLNGMVTNSIHDLKPGQGCYNFVLSAQGRIQGTLTAFALEDEILLQTDRFQVAPLSTLFDRFIIMDDVELTPAPFAGLGLIGPKATSLLAAVDISTDGLNPATALSQLELARVTWHDRSFKIIHAHSPIVPRFELWSTPETIAILTEALSDAGAASVAPEALEHLRILEGTPRYGTDIRDRDLPQETSQDRALHFAKGCYVGQEIVERIRSRGAVHRTFTGFRLRPDQPGTLPASGTPLTSNGKPVGELSSTATIAIKNGETVHLALGYARREAIAPVAGRVAPLSYPGGEAVSAPLPFASSSPLD